MAMIDRNFTFATNGTVTANDLHNLIDSATIYQDLITGQQPITSVGTNYELLIADGTNPNAAPNAVTVYDLFEDALTAGTYTNANISAALTYGTATGTRLVSANATITTGTIATLNSTTGTIATLNSTTGTIATLNSTTGTIPTLVATTLITTGTGTAAAPAIVPTGDTNTGIFFPAADTLAATTNGTERLRIDASGNVGIGIASPISSIHVKQATPVSKITLEDLSTNRVGQIGGGSDGDGGFLSFSIGNNSGSITEYMRISSAGEVFIAGTTDQGIYNLQVNGTGVWGAGAYVNGSDSRIKEDIQPIASGLDVVEKLNPVTYKYKETWSSDQSIQSGFIAQELLTALDGQIYVDGVVQQGGTEGYYSVAYQNLIPVLAKAIQELKAKNDSLEARLQALEAK